MPERHVGDVLREEIVGKRVLVAAQDAPLAELRERGAGHVEVAHPQDRLPGRTPSARTLEDLAVDGPHSLHQGILGVRDRREIRRAKEGDRRHPRLDLAIGPAKRHEEAVQVELPIRLPR